MRKTIYQKILETDLTKIDNICDKDAQRTSNLKKLFKNPEQPGTQLVFNICKAIGAYFPRAGYCQGRMVNFRDEFHDRLFIRSFWIKRN